MLIDAYIESASGKNRSAGKTAQSSADDRNFFSHDRLPSIIHVSIMLHSSRMDRRLSMAA